MTQPWRAFGRRAQFRSAFEWFGFACAAVIALVLMRVPLDVLTRPAARRANRGGAVRQTGKVKLGVRGPWDRDRR